MSSNQNQELAALHKSEFRAVTCVKADDDTMSQCVMTSTAGTPKSVLEGERERRREREGRGDQLVCSSHCEAAV